MEHPVKSTPSIRTLPIELLIVIFTLALARDHATVVVLAQICQDLRHLVVSTPSLWSTLSLSSNKPLQKAALWTSRNQGLLRGLYIREWDDDIAKTLASMIQGPAGQFTHIICERLQFLRAQNGPPIAHT